MSCVFLFLCFHIGGFKHYLSLGVMCMDVLKGYGCITDWPSPYPNQAKSPDTLSLALRSPGSFAGQS